MTSVRIDLDHGAIDNMLHGRGGEVNRVMGGFAGLATKAVREVSDQRITHRTRRYRESIKATLTRPDALEVAADVPYALYLEEGTRPHKIDSPVLIIDVGWRFIRRHPGTKPYHILRDGIAEAGKHLNQLAER